MKSLCWCGIRPFRSDREAELEFEAVSWWASLVELDFYNHRRVFNRVDDLQAASAAITEFIRVRTFPSLDWQFKIQKSCDGDTEWTEFPELVIHLKQLSP
ncbi:MAG: hypothetical protein GY807_02435 [Gammaproteobacteria bacterium]|nr:hypothetical protein [Gammaproteobacteria bacterium]